MADFRMLSRIAPMLALLLATVVSGTVFAQSSIDEQRAIFKRWAPFQSFSGTVTWNFSGTAFETVAVSESGNAKAVVDEVVKFDPNLTGRFYSAAFGFLAPPSGPIGTISTFTAHVTETSPGCVETIEASKGTSPTISVSLDIYDPDHPLNPQPGSAVYGIRIAAMGKRFFCAGSSLETAYIMPLPQAGVPPHILIPVPLPVSGSELSGSVPLNTGHDISKGSGVLSWKFTATPKHIDDPVDDPCEKQGRSTVECENQTLREDIRLTGTPLTLSYSSVRVPGRTKGNAVAQAHTASLGGWSFSSHHRYDKDANCMFLGDGRRLGAIALGEIKPTTAGGFQIASSDGRELYIFASDGRHLKTRDTLTGADVLTYAYDAAQRLTSVTDVSGNVTRIERNVAGKMTAVVSPFDQRTTLTTDANGYIASVTNPNGEVVRMTYTAKGLMTSMTNPRGIKASYNYDAEGRLLRDDDAAGGFLKLSRVTNSDQSIDVTLTTAQARTTKYHVSPFPNGGEARTIVSPANLTTTINRDNTNSTSTTSPDGTKTAEQLAPDPRFGLSAPIVKNSFATMPSGLKLATAGNRAVTLANASDPFSLTSLADTTSINGRTYTSNYDAATRTFTDTSPQGRQSKVMIDAKGRVVSQQIAGLFPVQYTYDTRGRVATVTAGVGTTLRTTTFAYDASSYLNSIVDPIGRRVSFARDAVGRVKQQTLPDGCTIAFAYDQNGNLTGLTPPGRPEHKFAYDQLDQTAEYQPPAAGLPVSKTNYTYNLDRDPTGIGRPDGKSIAMAYDSAGRMSSITLSRGALRYAYHPTTGNLSTVDSPDSVRLGYGYDGSLPISETWSGAVSGTLKRRFDNNFRVVETQVNAETPIANSYDLDGLLIKAGDLTLSRTPQNGLLTGSKLGVVSDSWTYNGFGEPLSYRASAAAATLYDVQFNRDALGRITAKIETVAGVRTIFAYAYDLAGRLSEVKRNGIVTSRYTYDSNGNRLTHTTPLGTVSGTYDDQDRLLSYRNATYTYTANGELKTKKVGNQTTTYNYDELGNLVGVSLPDGKKITYVIDGASRRVGKKINGVLVQAFLYDGRLRPVAELDGTGRVVSRLVYASRINVPDYIVKGGSTYRVETDHLGSPRLLVAVATGVVAQKVEYDQFGNVLADSNPGVQPFGFAGGLHDSDTGLVRFGKRDYDPTTGRWTAKDRALFRGKTSNLFAYSRSDPVNIVDPLGLAPRDNLYGLPRDFWRWFHRQPGFNDLKGPNGQVPQDLAEEARQQWEHLGRPGPDNKGRDRGKRCGPEPEDELEGGDPFGDDTDNRSVSVAIDPEAAKKAALLTAATAAAGYTAYEAAGLFILISLGF